MQRARNAPFYLSDDTSTDEKNHPVSEVCESLKQVPEAGYFGVHPEIYTMSDAEFGMNMYISNPRVSSM